MCALDGENTDNEHRFYLPFMFALTSQSSVASWLLLYIDSLGGKPADYDILVGFYIATHDLPSTVKLVKKTVLDWASKTVQQEMRREEIYGARD